MTERVDLVSGVPEHALNFAAWVRPHIPAMARLASRLATRENRDDVVQEALARAWLKRHHFDAAKGAPSAWLLAITADQARKAMRRARRFATTEERAGPALDRDKTIDVERAVARLPRRQRMAVDCFYFADLSIAETAAVMGCSEGTVKSTLSDARARLRSELEVSG